MLIQSKKNDHYLTFDLDKHKYILDGNRVPGATTISGSGYPTSIGLVNWQIAQGSEWTIKIIRRLLKNKPDRKFTKTLLEAITKKSKKASAKAAKRAATIGVYVHDYAYYIEIKKFNEANNVLQKIVGHTDEDKIRNGIDRFIEWQKENGDEMVASEAIVASVKHQFGGKFDRLATRNGKYILSDFKTSNSIHLSQFVQLGAYSLAIREWLGINVEGLEILRFGKDDGTFQTLLIKKPEEIKMFEEQAVRCRETYEFTKLESDKRWRFGGKK